MKETWEEEKRCPRTSPLTLTSITKPPPNKEKWKAKKIEEERRERREENTEQAIMVSLMKEREKRERSMSPIWNPSPDAKDYNQEQVGRSGQQSNTIDIMEMLRKIKQGMQERDQQLKLQLQLRDEYMDAELK